MEAPAPLKTESQITSSIRVWTVYAISFAPTLAGKAGQALQPKPKAAPPSCILAELQRLHRKARRSWRPAIGSGEGRADQRSCRAAASSIQFRRWDEACTMQGSQPAIQLEHGNATWQRGYSASKRGSSARASFWPFAYSSSASMKGSSSPLRKKAVICTSSAKTVSFTVPWKSWSIRTIRS